MPFIERTARLLVLSPRGRVLLSSTDEIVYPEDLPDRLAALFRG